MRSDHYVRRSADVRGLLLLGAILAHGCSKKVPYNPAVEIVNSPPTVENRERITELDIQVNGRSLLNETIEVTQGQPVCITGRVDLDTSKMTSPGATTLLHIRMLPPDASENDWFMNRCTMEWVGAASGPLKFEGQPDAPPGLYEFRAYLMMHELYADLPTFDLIASGELRVLPPAQGDRSP